MPRISKENRHKIFKEKTLPFAMKQGMKHPFWSSYVFGVRFELLALPEYLQPKEIILTLAQGQYMGSNSLIVVTDKRILILDRGWLGGLFKKKKDEVYYASVNGAKPVAHFFLTDLIINTSSGLEDMKIARLWGSDADRVDNAIAEAHQNSIRPDLEEEDAKSSSDTLTYKIQALKSLLNDNEITQDEYNKLRDELLSKI